MALGGFLFTGLAALGSYQVMPMPTRRLRQIRVSTEHIWLAGAATEYLDQLPTWESV